MFVFNAAVFMYNGRCLGGCLGGCCFGGGCCSVLRMIFDFLATCWLVLPLTLPTLPLPLASEKFIVRTDLPSDPVLEEQEVVVVAAGNADAFVEDVVLEVNEDEDDIDLRFRFAAEAVFGKGDGLTVRSSKARNKLSLAKSITTVMLVTVVAATMLSRLPNSVFVIRLQSKPIDSFDKFSFTTNINQRRNTTKIFQKIVAADAAATATAAVAAAAAAAAAALIVCLSTRRGLVQMAI